MRTILFFSLLVFLSACSEEPSTTTPDPVDQEPTEMTGKEILDSLQSVAIQEDDLSARLQASIRPIQQAFTESESAMPDLSEVTVEIDDNCILRIVNRANGLIETRVDLNKLNPQGFSLIRDEQEGEFPGVRIAAQNNEPVVEIYRNGELFTRDNELVIKLKDRSSIEAVTPVLLQTMLICSGEI
jgi:hypothetical protein